MKKQEQKKVDGIIKGSLIFNKKKPHSMAFVMHDPDNMIVGTKLDLHPDAMHNGFDPETHEGFYNFVIRKKKK